MRLVTLLQIGLHPQRLVRQEFTPATITNKRKTSNSVLNLKRIYVKASRPLHLPTKLMFPKLMLSSVLPSTQIGLLALSWRRSSHNRLVSKENTLVFEHSFILDSVLFGSLGNAQSRQKRRKVWNRFCCRLSGEQKQACPNISGLIFKVRKSNFYCVY